MKTTDYLRQQPNASCGCLSQQYSKTHRRKNVVGQKNNRLLVLEMLYEYGDSKQTHVKCLCDCGKECIVSFASWRTGNTKSCGCAKIEACTLGNRTDERGQKFGSLTVIDIDWNHKPTLATCQCDCGNVITIRKSHLKTGHTTSCGCKSHQNHRPKVDYSKTQLSSGVKFLRVSHFDENKKKWMWVCQCPWCGSEFITVPAYVLSLDKTSCGCHAVQSIGERVIEQWLDDNHIPYQKQFRLSDCRDKHTLPFDFAILDLHQNIIALIEYDGRQHYESIDVWGGEDALKIQRYHDEIKTKYCIDNNIPLLRFTYLQSFEEIKNELYIFCKSVETVIPPLVTTEVSLFS